MIVSFIGCESVWGARSHSRSFHDVFGSRYKVAKFACDPDVLGVGASNASKFEADALPRAIARARRSCAFACLKASMSIRRGHGKQNAMSAMRPNRSAHLDNAG